MLLLTMSFLCPRLGVYPLHFMVTELVGEFISED